MLFCALTCSAGPHTSACQQIQSTRTAKTAARIVRRAYRLKRPAERFVTLITNAPAWMSTSALWWLPHRHATCSAVCPTPFAVDGLTPAAMSLLISAGKFFWATESRSTREWRNASASTDRTQTSRGGRARTRPECALCGNSAERDLTRKDHVGVDLGGWLRHLEPLAGVRLLSPCFVKLLAGRPVFVPTCRCFPARTRVTDPVTRDVTVLLQWPRG